ncbi:MAG TPA: J domain-containing protein [Candidatus Binataceae bacterium]|nr:J domain-containing protein [Candidatus Binataceae bacterium]
MKEQSKPPNYYELLGVKPSATKAEIRAAFRTLILKYHPDRNPDPAAVEYTRVLNEAHTVLANERKRQLYDEWLRASATSSSGKVAAEPGQESDRRPVPDFCCSHCGRKDSSLRLVAMYYVTSFLVVTYKRAASGIWCQRCTAREAAKRTFLSALLGWWGFPWGPIYTLQALFVNATGGLQSASNNAALLRAVAYQLYTRSERDEAALALSNSLRLETDAATAEFLKYLEDNGAILRQPSFFWRVANAVPSGLVIAVLVIIVFVLSIQPSGYRAEYAPPRQFAAAPEKLRSPADEKANDLVSQLAQLVAADSPVVGTHFDGTRQVREHVLDRSKFDPDQVMSLANQIYALLTSGASDKNGFIASAYFNARLFTLSIYIVNGVTFGLDIKQYVNQVKELAQDRFLSNWLSASQFSISYSALLVKLDAVMANYRPGSSIADLQRNYEMQMVTIKELGHTADTYRARNPDAYNSLVPIYNADLRRTSRLASRLNFQAKAADDLDLAFNQCMDPAILMSQFDEVDLTQRNQDSFSHDSDGPGSNTAQN